MKSYWYRKDIILYINTKATCALNKSDYIKMGIYFQLEETINAQEKAFNLNLYISELLSS